MRAAAAGACSLLAGFFAAQMLGKPAGVDAQTATTAMVTTVTASTTGANTTIGIGSKDEGLCCGGDVECRDDLECAANFCGNDHCCAQPCSQDSDCGEFSSRGAASSCRDIDTGSFCETNHTNGCRPGDGDGGLVALILVAGPSRDRHRARCWTLRVVQNSKSLLLCPVQGQTPAS
jgi:hypothetical protein